MLDQIITRGILKNLAGTTAFARGEEYFTSNLVDQLRDTGDKVSARVEGSEIYRVELWNDDGELNYDCTCPRSAEGYFCKHCVAVGLAWIADQNSERDGGDKTKKKRSDPWQTIRDYLALQTPDVLTALVLDAAQRDDRLFQSLLLKAERSGTGGNLQKVFHKAIDKATRIRDFVDWREASDFTGNLDQIVESLAELLTPDNSAMLVELAEYAIERVEDAMQHIDDSNGEVGSIVAALGDLHIKACELAKPDPEDLAERLFHLETTSDFGICSFDASTYRDALGVEGLKRYRELAEAEWDKIEPRSSNDSYDSKRYRITHIMESLARVSGNVEELVAIKARDLTSAYQYLTIAEIWAKAGQDEKALDWAEHGLQAFPKMTDNRLRNFLVHAYLQRGRNEEALQLTWIQFEERSTLEHYKKLHAVAEQLGVWPEQRERALARVHHMIAHEAAATTRWKPEPSIPNYSLRLEIALWEDNLEDAWEAAHTGICHRELLIRLAGKLEPVRADDALTIYMRVIPPIVEQTNNTAYADAIKLIRRIEKIMEVRKQQSDFGNYLAELRARFKPKRNFIKLLDEVAARTRKTGQ